MTGLDTLVRGSTTVPRQVVARIAEQAAAETAASAAGRGARPAARPDADCELYGRTAVLRLEVDLAHPVPLAATLRSLRAHVVRRVEALAGVSVGRLDVEIRALRPQDPARGGPR
ncbi:Asp23/Gls24 family envelope stress response protein [Brachybacterium phenoliresistens]|uniref:Asp23/Gls24 family envelope stress response protein n=1 Tax=Brachybacterium phenoliresistens TaxID=396014 RepID=UPI0018DE80C6|nr:Asp23/Gls24 family envelope stress response protein [Brachybacterium phenoliresistens]